MTISFWESMDAVRRFAGDDPERARFCLGDEDLLIEKDLHVDHYEVISADFDHSTLP